jgi:hypothetical protein
MSVITNKLPEKGQRNEKRSLAFFKQFRVFLPKMLLYGMIGKKGGNNMKKIFSLLLAILMLAACTAFADANDMAGSYKATKMSENGQDISDQLEMLDAFGMSIYLTVNEDSTAELMMMGEKMPLVLDFNAGTAKSTEDGSEIPFSYKTGEITITNEGSTIVFTPIDASEVNSETPDFSALLTDALGEAFGEPVYIDPDSYSLKDETVIDNEKCTFIIEEVVDNGTEVIFKVFCENKTDKNLLFSVDNVIVNGYVSDPFWASTVAAGKKAKESFSFNKGDLSEYGLLPIDELSFILRVSDDDDWMAEPVVESRFTVYPNGKKDVVPPERLTTPTEKVIADTDDFSFIMLDETTDIFGHAYRAYLENKTDKNLVFSWDNVSVNGFMNDPYWGYTLPAHSRAYTGISFYNLEEIGIKDPSQIEEIEFKLTVSDADDWAANNLMEQVCTYTPVK